MEKCLNESLIQNQYLLANVLRAFRPLSRIWFDDDKLSSYQKEKNLKWGKKERKLNY